METKVQQLRLHNHYLDLWHAPQLHPWGCMHHSIYAATGNERFLENVDDMSTEGVARLVQRLGYWHLAHYAHPGKVKADASVWQAILEHFPHDYTVLELSIDSLRYADTTHSVAVAVNMSACTDLPGVPFAVVSDSGVPDFVHYASLEAFLESPYALAYTIAYFYRLPDAYTPMPVWTLDAPHLKTFDWSQYPPAQAFRPAPSPAGGETP